MTLTISSAILFLPGDSILTDALVIRILKFVADPAVFVLDLGFPLRLCLPAGTQPIQAVLRGEDVGDAGTVGSI